jgi:hypothetical protein
MGREMYGRWGEALDPPTLAKALLALGLTASADPDAVTWTTKEQIVPALQGVVDELRQRDFRLPWNREDPWPWTDPLLLGGWRSYDVEREPSGRALGMR